MNIPLTTPSCPPSIKTNNLPSSVRFKTSFVFGACSCHLAQSRDVSWLCQLSYTTLEIISARGESLPQNLSEQTPFCACDTPSCQSGSDPGLKRHKHPNSLYVLIRSGLLIPPPSINLSVMASHESLSLLTSAVLHF